MSAPRCGDFDAAGNCRVCGEAGRCPNYRRPTSCPECSPEGTLDTEWAYANGACLFGCGSHVDTDMGICPECQEHSCDRAGCEVCGAEYENWHGAWTRALSSS